MRLLTVGHSTASQAEFTKLLTEAGIEALVDIRSYPGSRRYPHFGKEAMSRWVPEAGPAYVHEITLGGRRHTPAGTESRHPGLTHKAFRSYADYMDGSEFDAGLSAVLDLASVAVTAVMCSEAVWWRCHRRLVSDAAVLLHGTEVIHLFPDGKLVAHHPLECAEIQDGKLVYVK